MWNRTPRSRVIFPISASGLTVAAGRRVRVWSDAPAIHGCEYDVSVTRGDTLWLSPRSNDPIGVPLKTVTRLDVHRTHSPLLGAAIGALAGGVIGAVLGNASAKEEARASDGLSRAEPFLLGTAGALLGLGIGIAVTGARG